MLSQGRNLDCETREIRPGHPPAMEKRTDPSGGETVDPIPQPCLSFRTGRVGTRRPTESPSVPVADLWWNLRQGVAIGPGEDFAGVSGDGDRFLSPVTGLAFRDVEEERGDNT